MKEKKLHPLSAVMNSAHFQLCSQDTLPSFVAALKCTRRVKKEKSLTIEKAFVFMSAPPALPTLTYSWAPQSQHFSRALINVPGIISAAPKTTLWHWNRLLSPPNNIKKACVSVVERTFDIFPVQTLWFTALSDGGSPELFDRLPSWFARYSDLTNFISN